MNRSRFGHEDIEWVRSQCVFTTHTPVPAGHDRFTLDHVGRVLGRSDIFAMHEVFCCAGELNMTYLALNLSHYVNGVAKKHGEVSRQLLQPKDAFHNYRIDHITNGVHLATWAAPPVAQLFDTYVPGWREDNASLRGAINIPEAAMWQAHSEAKKRLIEEVNHRTSSDFDAETLTLAFARRAATYKRANLLLADTVRLKNIAKEKGRLQVIYAGKAHPLDEAGKQIIQQIIRAKDSLRPEVKIVYLENYDWDLARLLVAGVDVWLNTPQPPLEASGTSGMKAALNGVPSLSVLDGWWVEGWVEGVTGWSIGHEEEAESDTELEAASLYNKLRYIILPLFYSRPEAYAHVMRSAIALNGSYFNSHRMMQQYATNAYRL